MYDLGGGTLDVTIMTVQNNYFDVRATSGDSHLGGEDFNKCLYDFLAAHFKKEEGVDISTNKRAKARLFTAVEKAKLQLSSKDSAKVEIDNLAENKDLNYELTKDLFAVICAPIFNKCIAPLQIAIDNSKPRIEITDIDEVIMVGGSTRMPAI